MTIKEIASIAGTSRGTVDRVLNGRGNVNSELSKKILLIAKEHNYQPNYLARSLVKSKENLSIGVVINSLGNEFFDEVLAGLHSKVYKYSNYGLSVIVKEIKGYSPQEQINAITEVLDKGVNALAIMPLDVPEVCEKLASISIPIVTFNTDVEIEKLAFVGCDYYNSGQLSGNLASLILGEKGGNVGIVVGSFNVKGHKNRIDGFTESVADEGNIKIIECIENTDDDKISYEVTMNMIKTHNPNLIYFGAAGIKGGVQAVIDSGKPIKVLTVDETKSTREFMDKKIISATVTQQPYIQGGAPIKILYDYLVNNKKPKEKYIFTENQIKLINSK